MKHSIRFAAVVILLLAIVPFGAADEGMYPLSEISRLDLKTKGLKIEPEEIYNPDGVSLVDAICIVGGGTGEFVSPDGLILTNHHVAFRAVAGISTPENDYLENGFLARTREEEAPARGYTCRITDSYRDVSDEILRGITQDMDALERMDTIGKRMSELARREEAENPGLECEVAEMFPGKSYVLFRYRVIRDVRLVYVPPLDIGNYGGEEDNWMWPRHTGDFSFLRAYVAPDGSPASYSERNVPFKPKRHLKVAPKGVHEEDFVFLLGYPGRTYRHTTSYFLSYNEEVTLPWTADWYDFQIGVLTEAGRNDRALELKLSSWIKGLSNTMKNYRGKLKGLRRLHLVDRRVEDEARLQTWIEADEGRRAKWADVLPRIGEVYREMRATARRDFLFRQLRRSVALLQMAGATADYMRKPVDERGDAGAFLARLQRFSRYLIPRVDKVFFQRLLEEAAVLSPGERIKAVDKILAGATGTLARQRIASFVESAYARSPLTDSLRMANLLSEKWEEVSPADAPLLFFADALNAEYRRADSESTRRKSELQALRARLLDAKMAHGSVDFIPDANRTIRFTYGYIRGYSPADATWYSPVTTLTGVIEKYTGRDPFDLPETLFGLYEKRKQSRFLDPILDDVPVAILYNTDTTGGNSGSPVLNARGELVGVNFDRAWEATINDYQWSERYSRSIAVDIRYILFITSELAGADFLLEEMGV